MMTPVVTAPRAVFGRQHLPTGNRASPNPILSGLPTQPEALGQTRAGVQPPPPRPVGGAGRSAGNGAPSPARVGVPRPPACHRARRHQVRCTPPLRFGPMGDGTCARRPPGGVGTGNVVLPFGRSSSLRRVEQGTMVSAQLSSPEVPGKAVRSLTRCIAGKMRQLVPFLFYPTSPTKRYPL